MPVTIMTTLIKLLDDISHCTLCAGHLPHTPRPVVRASDTARLLIVGQAPGRKVHETGIPWNDPSGKRLRNWLQMNDDTFYNVANVAIIPMGFCYPGTGKSGDLPPRPECAPQWHRALHQHLPRLQLTLLIGQYAQKAYLPDDYQKRYKTLTERVRHQQELPDSLFVLPHPSPRNQLWLKRNLWFEQETLPLLRQRLKPLGIRHCDE